MARLKGRQRRRMTLNMAGQPVEATKSTLLILSRRTYRLQPPPSSSPLCVVVGSATLGLVRRQYNPVDFPEERSGGPSHGTGMLLPRAPICSLRATPTLESSVGRIGFDECVRIADVQRWIVVRG